MDMNLSYDEVFTMFCCIGCLAVFCGLAGMNHDASAADPAVPAGITLVRNIPYRRGPNKQWRLDLALRQGSAGKPRPAIVVIHGGGWVEGDKSSFEGLGTRSPAGQAMLPAHGPTQLQRNC
jgi:acetyl esterase/lipase